MRRSPLLEFQVAIYQHFKKYNAPIFEDLASIPGDQFPRIVIGEFAGKAMGSKASYTQEVTLTLHLYSTCPGKEEINKVLDSAIRCVNEPLPEMGGGFYLLNLGVDEYEVFSLEDEDGNFAVYHGTLTIKATIHVFVLSYVVIEWEVK